MPLYTPNGTSDHDALSNVSADDHHAQVHTVDGANHTGTLVIGQIPTGTSGTTVALGNAAAGLITTHEGLADPHTGYVREADASWVDLTDSGATTLHSHAGGGDPVQGSFAPGSFTVATGKYAAIVNRIELTSTQRLTLEGTSTLRLF